MEANSETEGATSVALGDSGRQSQERSDPTLSESEQVVMKALGSYSNDIDEYYG